MCTQFRVILLLLTFDLHIVQYFKGITLLRVHQCVKRKAQKGEMGHIVLFSKQMSIKSSKMLSSLFFARNDIVDTIWGSSENLTHFRGIQRGQKVCQKDQKRVRSPCFLSNQKIKLKNERSNSRFNFQSYLYLFKILIFCQFLGPQRWMSKGSNIPISLPKSMKRFKGKLTW